MKELTQIWSNHTCSYEAIGDSRRVEILYGHVHAIFNKLNLIRSCRVETKFEIELFLSIGLKCSINVFNNIDLRDWKPKNEPTRNNIV